MKNASISALFSTGASDEHKSVTLSLSSRVHDVAARNADALRIKKGRWLELLIENAINEYSELGGDDEKGGALSENLVHAGRMESHQKHGEKAGHYSSEFDSLRNHDGGE